MAQSPSYRLRSPINSWASSFCILCLLLSTLRASGQVTADYLKANAVSIEKADSLGDPVYKLLSPFQIVLFGEMHGTNESAAFVIGLTELFTRSGDSVLVGLELPSTQMLEFMSDPTDDNIYGRGFFHDPPYASGKESEAWASILATLNDNPRVRFFFFDMNPYDGQIYERDSLMYAKIKAQYQQHPAWKIVALSGNFHNRLSMGTMAHYFQKDKSLASKVCSLNMEYQEGTCLANFGNGMEMKNLGHPPTVYDTALDVEQYLVLIPPDPYYPYNGLYYTRKITAAKMIHSR